MLLKIKNFIICTYLCELYHIDMIMVIWPVYIWLSFVPGIILLLVILICSYLCELCYMIVVSCLWLFDLHISVWICSVLLLLGILISQCELCSEIAVYGFSFLLSYIHICVRFFLWGSVLSFKLIFISVWYFFLTD